MIHQTSQLCFIYIGGPMSMETSIVQTDLKPAQVYGVLSGSSYVCCEIIELRSPERLVVVRGYADKCRTVRQVIFEQVAEVSYLVKKIGDVDVAMFRYIESHTQWQYNEREPLRESIDLAATVHRQYQASKLAKRQMIKDHNNSLQAGK
jgi:hypothetical protein